MADTNFVAHVTTILSAWLQDVNNLCYRQGAPFVSLAGGNLTGAVNSNQGAVAATATTTPLWVAANGNEQIWSNTPTITAFPDAPQAGASRVVYPAAGTIFTNGGNISVQGGANYTTQAGDKVTIHAITTSMFSVWVDVEATTSITSSFLTSSTLGTGVQTIAHGLGRVPNTLIWCLVVTTANNNWSIGDEIYKSISITSGTEDHLVVGADATNIIVADSITTIGISDKSTGAAVVGDLSNFKLKVVVS